MALQAPTPSLDGMPQEIIDRIYSMVVDSRADLERNRYHYRRSALLLQSKLALKLVCRQLYAQVRQPTLTYFERFAMSTTIGRSFFPRGYDVCEFCDK